MLLFSSLRHLFFLLTCFIGPQSHLFFAASSRPRIMICGTLPNSAFPAIFRSWLPGAVNLPRAATAPFNPIDQSFTSKNGKKPRPASSPVVFHYSFSPCLCPFSLPFTQFHRLLYFSYCAPHLSLPVVRVTLNFSYVLVSRVTRLSLFASTLLLFVHTHVFSAPKRLLLATPPKIYIIESAIVRNQVDAYVDKSRPCKI